MDVVVAGAGPCGIAAGIAAHQAGLSCTLFDRGCVVSSISKYPTHMTFFSTPDRLEIGGVPFVVVGDRPTRREALRYYQRLAREFALDVHQYEEVRTIDRVADDAHGDPALGDAAPGDSAPGNRGHRDADARFRITTLAASGAAHEYAAGNVVVATGYFDSPNLLGVPGEDLSKVAHNYREPHVYYDQDVVVVGGGNSAVDAALELHRWGARVTIVHFGSELDPNIKPWVRPEVEARLRDGDIKACFDARIAEIRPETVLVQRQSTGKVEELRNDWVLAMTGYTPDGRLLRRLGVDFDPQTGIPHHDPATMETNVRGVFIAGVLSAGFNANKVFIENGRGHGALITAAIAGRK